MEVSHLNASIGQMSIGLSNEFLTMIAEIATIFLLISLFITVSQLEPSTPELKVIYIVIALIFVILFIMPLLDVQTYKLKPFKEQKPSMIAMKELLKNRKDAIVQCYAMRCQETYLKNSMLCKDLEVLSKTLNEILIDKGISKRILKSLKSLLIRVKRF